MIVFSSIDALDKDLVLGGVSTLGSDDIGVVGPFPRYSITREDITTTDGTYVNSKFNITVTGTATLKSDTNQDMLVKGQRQAAVQGEALILSQLNRHTWPMHGNGKLSISPYGGLGNQIEFVDARIVSLELPEQDETAGVQNQQFTVQFQAYEDSTTKSTNSNNDGDRAAIEYKLASVEETWDLNPTDEYVTDVAAPVGDEPSVTTTYRTYTLTHTLSATGLKKMSESTTGLANDGESWRQAAKYIGKRLENTGGISPTTITTNILNLTETGNNNNFNPFQMDGDSSNFDYNLANSTIPNPAYDDTSPTSDSNPLTIPNTATGGKSYAAYDHVRTINANVAAGSYTVTETWVLSWDDANKRAIADIEVSVDDAQAAQAVAITVAGTIKGISTKSSTSVTNDKYDNALKYYKNLNMYHLANSFYQDTGLGIARKDPTDDTGATKLTLRSTEFGKSLGINESTGTITFSVSFNDMQVRLADAIEDSVEISDTGGSEVVAIIGVILRAAGPIIQDMGTITEKRKSVTYTAKVMRDKRHSWPPTTGTTPETIVNGFAPFDVDGSDKDRQWIQTKNESYNPDTGDYSFVREWVYQ